MTIQSPNPPSKTTSRQRPQRKLLASTFGGSKTRWTRGRDDAMKEPNKTPEVNIEKVCPCCGGVLVVRANRTTKTQFIGCTRWPECNYTEKLPESVRMRQMGHPTLF